MPAQTRPRKKGLPDLPSQGPFHAPGEGGYDYPPGPYGRTGLRGSTPASGFQRRQNKRNVRKPQLTPTGAQAEWTYLPPRQPSGQPQQPPATEPYTRRAEHRMTPVIGAYQGDVPFQKLRNSVARRVYAIPTLERPYRASPNPGKTDASLTGTSQYHPDTPIFGEPDGKPVPGMTANPGLDAWSVVVQSRFFSREGGMEGYAMNRREHFTKGGTPAPYPDGYKGDRHLRGGRYTGQRYFGSIAEQQKIGLPSDSYGIARRRGPNHRPVRFEQPAPWSANYYDVPPDQGDQSPDMIHRAPSSRGGGGRKSGKARRG